MRLVGRREDAIEAVREECEGLGAQVTASTTMEAIYPADLILTVTSAVHAVIEPKHLKPGCVVCDVAHRAAWFVMWLARAMSPGGWRMSAMTCW